MEKQNPAAAARQAIKSRQPTVLAAVLGSVPPGAPRRRLAAHALIVAAERGNIECLDVALAAAGGIVRIRNAADAALVAAATRGNVPAMRVLSEGASPSAVQAARKAAKEAGQSWALAALDLAASKAA